MASDLENFADSLLIEGRAYNEDDQNQFRDRTGTASYNLSNVPNETVDNRLLKTDSISFDKLDPSVRSSIGSGFDPDKLIGNWDPNTNSPVVPVADPSNAGYWFWVYKAGTSVSPNVAGEFLEGDRIWSSGTEWERMTVSATNIPDNSIENKKLKYIIIRKGTTITVGPGVQKTALWGIATRKPGGGNACLFFQDTTGKTWPEQINLATNARIDALELITNGWAIVENKGVTINGVFHKLAFGITCSNYTKLLMGQTQTGLFLAPGITIPDPGPDPDPSGYTKPDCVVYTGPGNLGLRAMYKTGESLINNDGKTYTGIQHSNGDLWLANSNKFNPSGSLCIINAKESSVAESAYLDLVPTIVFHIGWNGQSLSLGTAANPVISSTSVYPSNSFMFNTGSQYGTGGIPVVGSSITSMIPLIEVFNSLNGSYESPLSGFANRFIAKFDASFGIKPTILQHNDGIGGTGIAGIDKGSVPYSNAMIEFARGRDIVVASGKIHEVPAILIEHGQRDDASGTSPTTYKNLLRQLRLDYDTDIKAINGQTRDVYIGINQCSGWNHYARLHGYAAPAQLQASIEDEFIFCYGPEYHLPFKPNDVHITGASSYRLGEYAAKALFYTLHRKKKFEPLRPIGFEKTSNWVIVTFNNEYPMALDTTIVTLNTNYGFEIAGATITGIPIISGNEVQIPISGIPASVAYAYTAVLGPNDGSGNPTRSNPGPITGPRGNLRQSNPEVSLRDGFHLYDWCVHFDPVIL